jgi:hypothetical protein
MSDLVLILDLMEQGEPPDTEAVIHGAILAESLKPGSRQLADTLLSPGWYANWNSDIEATVVFPGKIFRYPHGDQAGRGQAQAHGRSVGVPEAQLDWTRTDACPKAPGRSRSA